MVPASHWSSSAWVQLARVSPRAVSQSRNAVAAAIWSRTFLDLVAGGGPAAQAAQLMPEGVSAQGLPVPGIHRAGDDLADPGFQGGETLVPCRERARCDHHRPQVERGCAPAEACRAPRA